MSKDIFFEIHRDLPIEGLGRNRYTRKAYNMLPHIKKPKILDIGCGSGYPTIELAKISNGTIIGIDIYQPYLEKFKEKIKKKKLENQVKAVNQSMFNIDFPKESFDIIWSEGSIFIIGFKKGLIEWKQYIKPNGFLVIHEMTWLNSNPPAEICKYWKKIYPEITTIPKNLEIIKKCNYKIIGYFPLPEDAWWDFYYNPLEKRINLLKEKYSDKPEALEVLNHKQQEIDMYKNYNKWYGSVFYILQRL